MKTLLILISSIACFSITGLVTDIPLKNQVIFKGKWKPTEKQTKKALKTIQAFLENPKDVSETEKADIQLLLQNNDNYCVQFTGVGEEDKKYIRCNFFIAKLKDDEFKYWRKQEIDIDDGGLIVWIVDYNVQSHKCQIYLSSSPI